MKCFRAILLSLFAFANSTFANTFTSDLSDLWWNANESGWGVTVTHQSEVIFLTFFVYDPSNRPTFYTGQTTYSNNTAQGSQVYSGQMYQTSGPWLGALFNPNAVSNRQVGTVNFTAFLDTATLTYSIDGIVVTKSLTRQTFRNNNLSGQFAGVLRSTASGCTNPIFNGTTEAIAGIGITHSGASFSMATNDGVEICNYSGNYTQAGRIGRSRGNYSCPGRTGTYDFVDIEATFQSISGRFTTVSSICAQQVGSFSILKR